MSSSMQDVTATTAAETITQVDTNLDHGCERRLKKYEKRWSSMATGLFWLRLASYCEATVAAWIGFTPLRGYLL